jgi:hypothetical protein
MRAAGYIAAARKLGPIVVAVLGIVVVGVAAVLFVNSEGFGYDFRAYDDAARRIVAGEPLYLPGTVEAYRDARYEGLYLYPPPLAIALVPLTVLAESAATVTWMVLRVVALVGACLVLPVSARARLVTLGLAGFSFPVLFDLNIGNVSIVILALCAIAWRWIGTPAAALSHAALALIRFPFLVFGFLWIVQRRFNSLAWTVVVGIALLVVTLPIVGLATYADYIAILRSLPDITTGEHNLSFRSTALEAGLPDLIGGITMIASYVLGLAAVVFAGRRRDESTAFVVTALATLLVAPFIHPHYLVLLLLPAAWLMDRGQWWGLGLPLLGWLPDMVLPFTGVLAIALVLAVSAWRPRTEAELAA